MQGYRGQLEELFAAGREELQLRLVHVGFSVVAAEDRDTYFEHAEGGVKVMCAPEGFVISFLMTGGEQRLTMPWGTPVNAVVRVAAGLAGVEPTEVFIRRFDCFDRINEWADELFFQATDSMHDGPMFDGNCESIMVGDVWVRTGESIAALWTGKDVCFRPAIP